MTRPDPLGVECDYCGAKRRRPCLVNPGAYRHLLKQREPHAARLRAAEQARREKEENRG